jgi:hypothetical protein
MRRFTGTEKAGLAVASVIVIGGLLMIIHPIDMTVFSGGYGIYGTGGPVSLQHVSKEMSRYSGGAAVLLGLGFASFVLCRSRE